jgi:hypothetical protein
MYNVLLVWVVGGALACFSPVIGNVPSVIETYPIRASVESCEFATSSYAILGLCLTYALDFALDLFDTTSGKLLKKTKRDGKPKIIIDAEKVVVLLGVFVLPMVAMLPRHTERLALIYMCASAAQVVLIGGYFMLVCFRYYRAYFPVGVTTLCLVTFVSTTVTWTWIINLGHDDVDHRRRILFYFQLLGPFVFLLLMLPWLYQEVGVNLVMPRARQLARRVARAYGVAATPAASERDAARRGVDTSRQQHAAGAEAFPAGFVLASICTVVFMSVVNSITPNFYDTRPSDILLLNLPAFAFQVSFMVLSLQFSKFEVTNYMLALLYSKRSYVR